MSTTTFGPLRSKLPRKPWIRDAHVRFWHCATCGRMMHEYIPDSPKQETLGAKKTPSAGDAAHAAASGAEAAPALLCCGAPMRLVQPAPASERMPELGLRYDLVGGFNDNAVKVYWDTAAQARPLWIALQTYTGVYLKHVSPTKNPPQVFPLADEDAYAYCDRDVCEKCLYCCKKGCVLYIHAGGGTLAALPLDEIAAYFRKQNS